MRGAEAGEATAIEGGADSAATGLGDRPEARRFLGYDDAYISASFAWLAD